MTVFTLNSSQRLKEDNNDDSLFYANPRFVYHLDDNFRARLTDLYREKVPEQSVVLDIMSSWDSHLPKDTKYSKVIGHGLNQSELERNERFDSFWVQDLNQNQSLPLDACSIDICLMAASWQYLQYPEAVSCEILRVMKPSGKLIISFSNRAFWTKAPRIWTEGTDIDHINYIENVLIAQGWSNLKTISETTKKTGVFSLLNIYGDPFFSVMALND